MQDKPMSECMLDAERDSQEYLVEALTDLETFLDRMLLGTSISVHPLDIQNKLNNIDVKLSLLEKYSGVVWDIESQKWVRENSRDEVVLNKDNDGNIHEEFICINENLRSALQNYHNCKVADSDPIKT